MIHGPSLGIGAVIASIVIIGMFFGFNQNETGLVLEPTPTIEQMGPAKVTMGTFLDNGSPILGSIDAPITLVEFGDYQCHFCNVFFHSTEDEILQKYVETGKVKMIFKDFNIIGPDSFWLNPKNITIITIDAITAPIPSEGPCINIQFNFFNTFSLLL